MRGPGNTFDRRGEHPGVSAEIGNLLDRPALTDELISSLEARALWARYGL